jgi:DNA-binding response OmpR family regulator
VNKVLFIEDNPEIYEINRRYLTEQGFETIVAPDGKTALMLLDKQNFDCLVLDVLLPDTDGFELCASIRKITAAPIIFLTCLDDTEDKIKGLMLGGDDYMTKPHDMKELAARIRVQLRRASEISLMKEQNALTVGKRVIQLSPTEFAIFQLLYENRDKVLTIEEICARFWPDEEPDDNLIAVYIKRIREKTAGYGEYIGQISNHYKKGYTLETPNPKGVGTTS